jgi:hypothetical protein
MLINKRLREHRAPRADIAQIGFFSKPCFGAQALLQVLIRYRRANPAAWFRRMQVRMPLIVFGYRTREFRLQSRVRQSHAPDSPVLLE